jgi:hypothetical protein
MALVVCYPRVEFASVRGPQSHQGETTFTRKVNHAGVALTLVVRRGHNGHGHGDVAG